MGRKSKSSHPPGPNPFSKALHGVTGSAVRDALAGAGNRTVRLNLRVTEREKALIDRVAAEAELNVTDTIVRLFEFAGERMDTDSTTTKRPRKSKKGTG